MKGIYVAGFLYGKTNLVFTTYDAAKAKSEEMNAEGFKTIVVMEDENTYVVWAT